jgi:hypothetical protein
VEFLLILASVGADGQVGSWSWVIGEADADYVKAQLGEPRAVMDASAEQILAAGPGLDSLGLTAARAAPDG